MLRGAHYWDFLSPVHYVIILCFVCAVVFLVKLLIQARRKSLVAAYVVLIFTSLLVGWILRQVMFPGGAMDESSYRKDKYELYSLRHELWVFHDDCGHYPTTEQGLGMLYNKTSDDRCKDTVADRPMKTHIKYTSDGASYEMETTRRFTIPGLVVRATNEEEERFYIRE